MGGTKNVLEACKINKINIPDLENDKDILDEYKNIFLIYKAQYSIFLTDKFFSWRKKIILKYLKRYNIVYLNFSLTNDILTIIDTINKLIEGKLSNQMDMPLKLSFDKCFIFITCLILYYYYNKFC